MKQNRLIRLNLILCFLENYSACSQSYTIKSEYTDEVKDFVSCWKSLDDIIHDLIRIEVASRLYDERCVRMDIWYLRKTQSSSTGIERTSVGGLDPECKVMFQTILQALLDVESGRPCDLGAWTRDVSPDFSTCTRGHHICAEQAEDYLMNVDDVAEEFSGLPCGTIEELVGKIKRAPIYKVGTLFQSRFLSA